MSDVEAKNSSGVVTVELHGPTAAITAGGAGTSGSLALTDGTGARRVLITSGKSPPPGAAHPGRPFHAEVAAADPIGPADVQLPVWKAPPERLTLDGEHGTIIIGSDRDDGFCMLTSDKGVATVQLQGATGTITLTDGKQRPSITLDGAKADVTVGRTDHGGKIVVHSKTGAATITIDGNQGDIVLANADCAEEFDVAASARAVGLAPGTVVVLDDDGAIRACSEDYDGRAAGVISGAGGYRPALVLDRRPSATPRLPVALLGKVDCWVDADAGAVRPGDLLTTSATTGHARKVTDRTRAFGAIIGKALGSLERGRGLVPILVTLR